MKINHRLCQRRRCCWSRCRGNAYDCSGPVGGARISVSPRACRRRLYAGGFAPDGRHNCWRISVTADVLASNWMIDGGRWQRRRRQGQPVSNSVRPFVRPTIFRLSSRRPPVSVSSCSATRRRRHNTDAQGRRCPEPQHCEMRSAGLFHLWTQSACLYQPT